MEAGGLFSPAEAGGAAGLNAIWRSMPSFARSGADKASLADELSVSRRTIERWVTASGQMRNPFPVRLSRVPILLWPARYQLRARLTLTLYAGWESRTFSMSPTEVFRRRSATVGDSFAWARDLVAGVLDPWLKTVWRVVEVAKEADSWTVFVTYERGSFDPSGPGERGGEEETRPPNEEPDSASWLFPDDQPLVRGLPYPGTPEPTGVRMRSWHIPRFGVHVYRTRRSG